MLPPPRAHVSFYQTDFRFTAGLSIGVGLIRIAFPESQQFLEAKAAGKKTASPGAFYRDLVKMLKAEWKMCIYCIILMTWVSIIKSISNPSSLVRHLTKHH